MHKLLLMYFPEVFFHSGGIEACPVATDLGGKQQEQQQQ